MAGVTGRVLMSDGRLRSVFSFLRPYSWHLAWLTALTGVMSIFAMLPPLLVRAALDKVLIKGQTRLLVPIAFLLLFVPLLNAFCAFIQAMGVTIVGQKFVSEVRNKVYSHLLSLSMRFFGRESSGKLVNRLLTDSANVQVVLTGHSIQVFSDLFCSIFAVCASFLINWRMALLLMFVVLLFVVNYKISIERIKRATKNYRGADDRMAGGLQNRLAVNLTVKTYGTENREHGFFSSDLQTSLGFVKEAQLAMNSFSMNTMLLRDFGRALIYFAGCAMVINGSATYGDVVAFTAYSVQLLWPAVRFSQLARQIQDVRVSVDRLFELLDEQPEIVDSPDALKPPGIKGHIVFKNVDFSYNPDTPVLHDFNLDVEPGQTVALVGPTGCGKTTILSLMLRFFDVTSGAITLDGIDIKDFDVRYLRKQFGIVLQEPMLFSVSLADNIRYARPEATMAEIEAAARLSEIDSYIRSLPDGYDTMVGGRNGVTLSVGQKQRISIARAALVNPVILVMDEATSSLDSESERAIQIAMDRFLKGRTSFVVAHRLSTIRNAGKIVLLNKGRIEECGTHDELLAARGKYSDLYHKHMGRGFITEE